MSTADYALLFTEGELAGKAYPLTATDLTIGRSRANAITLVDGALSRNHIKIRAQGSDIMVEDLDSAHGTFLNGKRLRGIVSLAEGDELKLGDQVLKVVSAEEVAGVMDKTALDLEALDQMADQAEAAASPEDEQDKTRFADDMDEEEQDETRYHQPKVAARYEEDEEDAKTRMLEDSATRMLDVDELQGLKPGKAPTGITAKVLSGIVLIALLLVGGAAYVVMEVNKEPVDPTAQSLYEDDQFGFRLSYPSVWVKTGSDPNAVIAFELQEAQGTIAQIKVYVDQSLDYEVEGLSKGFEGYKDVLADRHGELRLSKHQVLPAGPKLLTMQYGFSTERMKGFGLFCYSGPVRFNVEASAAKSRYGEVNQLLWDLLRSFRLNGEQQQIDFPMPDEKIRNLALSNPAALEKLAQRDLVLARDILARRQVRLDNLHRAVVQYQTALTRAATLSTRPAFYDGAARELLEATNLLKQEVNDLEFAISMAEKVGDYEQMAFELNKLITMVPDRSDPVHIYAADRLKQL